MIVGQFNKTIIKRGKMPNYRRLAQVIGPDVEKTIESPLLWFIIGFGITIGSFLYLYTKIHSTFPNLSFLQSYLFSLKTHNIQILLVSFFLFIGIFISLMAVLLAMPIKQIPYTNPITKVRYEPKKPS